MRHDERDLITLHRLVKGDNKTLRCLFNLARPRGVPDMSAIVVRIDCNARHLLDGRLDKTIKHFEGDTDPFRCLLVWLQSLHIECRRVLVYCRHRQGHFFLVHHYHSSVLHVLYARNGVVWSRDGCCVQCCCRDGRCGRNGGRLWSRRRIWVVRRRRCNGRLFIVDETADNGLQVDKRHWH